ncbi:MAG: PepSY domain-containing protein [Gemmatimonadaceae bacterium]|nr:PepSY domain-containing protein [Gemmatimonadaceae bacterium]NUO94459.1 PepSY domain-containing protein [Gemmatimonadaceae bacterium]NUP56613.1 PepSY domain-containing protein [Gemmatimonadaceae bacterium]NUP71062.1 PepSY domain-containing protein [Gemmatimonadaceae bacterium]NUR33031.1 PepSY domain-containing protein [Gemmatimonadaceae bacterium]
MNRFIIATAFAAAIALPAAGQSTTATSNGQVNPTSSAAKVKVQVNQSLASTAKVSGDSAYAIARAHADNGEVSSAKLRTEKGRLLYSVQVLNKSKRESTVKVDAMTGEVIEAEQHGGVKSTVLHHKENKKLLDAKRDSAAKNP